MAIVASEFSLTQRWSIVRRNRMLAPISSFSSFKTVNVPILNGKKYLSDWLPVSLCFSHSRISKNVTQHLQSNSSRCLFGGLYILSLKLPTETKRWNSIAKFWAWRLVSLFLSALSRFKVSLNLMFSIGTAVNSFNIQNCITWPNR